MRLIVFSDLDGTLLDHETYSWDDAKPALRRLAEMGAMVVLASSKTVPEIKPLQRAMGLEACPAIVENGAGIIGLERSQHDADEYKEVRGHLDSLPDRLRSLFLGFGDMSVNLVAEKTGLSLAEAERAKARSFSEPGIWGGSDVERDRFVAALNEQGIKAQQGGRFLTLSKGRTKADAMREITARYRPQHTIALGDAPNDVEMLKAADYGVVVSNPQNAPLPHLQGENTGRILRTTLPGPRGWSWAIEHLLQTLSME
ncbi:HAD-IIB family hydrolase [Hoeflea prorocentri]|uniref:HAD-IIB family hydrolase n=1 Tax=Hoeflea prorocentri TaxID=1922333 RepID=A0A9X3ZJ56_9HYPH|nr:HAD-IIB family hydrolase [Hoeflea prorocentri]MCY6382455.1 HAD-IIB family hydrolase [Hoeflea prorocentri]MDA5400255.1 HAD-IIB family hydrolase [Hoeflea prorocentri]